MTDGRVIVIFGSAGLRDKEKRRMMAEVSTQWADISILTAEDPRTESLEGILDEMAGGARRQGGVEGKILLASTGSRRGDPAGCSFSATWGRRCGMWKRTRAIHVFRNNRIPLGRQGGTSLGIVGQHAHSRSRNAFSANTGKIMNIEIWKTPITLEGQFVRLEPLSEAACPSVGLGRN